MKKQRFRRTKKLKPSVVTLSPQPKLSLVESNETRWARFGINEPAELLHNFAVVAKDRGHKTAASVALRRAIGMCPESGFLWCALGVLMWDIGDLDAAVDALQKAQDLGADGAVLHSNIGLILAALKRFPEAEKNFHKAIELDPTNASVLWNTALLYLESGDWERGFEQYECRKAYLGPAKFPILPYPLWDGEDLNGKTIFIRAEQGAGDRIMLSRYIYWLKEKYPTVLIKFCPGDELLALFSSMRTIGVELIFDNEPAPKGLDYGCFLGSLPRFHGSRIGEVPPEPGLMRKMVEPLRLKIPEPRLPAVKVGVAWTGNPGMGRNQERTIPLPLMLEFEDNPLVQLYNLQFGPPRDELVAMGADQLINDLVPVVESRGYIGTAIAMTKLDLVITACTSVAHLAGALGVPCWVLLCHNPYWVWLREGDRSMWYPSVRLFRQEQPGNWGPVIDQVKVELAKYAEDRLNGPGPGTGSEKQDYKVA